MCHNIHVFDTMSKWLRCACHSTCWGFLTRFYLSFHAVLSVVSLPLFVNEVQMAQQCLQNEYFDELLKACKLCQLRCSNTPPPRCQRYCNATKGTNVILWTCLGLSLLVSLTVFVLMFLLRKMSSQPLKDEYKSTGSALRKEANADVDDRKDSRSHEEMLPRSLEYTVEECTCEDCVKSQQKVDSDDFFPLPAMEEGATILVTTKTNDYCNGLQAAGCFARMEKSILTR